MTATLRPMSLGEILDRAFQIYRSQFLALLAIAAIPVAAKSATALLGFLLNAFLTQTTLSAAVKLNLMRFYPLVVGRFAGSFSHYLLWPLFAILASQILLGDQLQIRSAVCLCASRWRSWLILAFSLWFIGSEFFRELRNSRFLLNAWLSSPFWVTWILTTVAGFVLIAPICLSAPAWSLEKLNVAQAIGRSWDLSQRSYVRMFLAWALFAVVEYGIAFTLGALLFLFLKLIPGNQQVLYGYTYSPFLISLPGYVASTLVAPLFPIALTLIYYDQRIRLEGFDIERLMDAAGMNIPIPAHASEAKIASAPLEETQA